MLLIGRGIKREEMKYSILTFFIVVLVTILSLTSSSNASTSTCSDATAAHLQTCLDQVERDESVLPGGPCSSSDWRCICTKQQGLADCFAVCPSQIPEDTANFDRNNCAGQHDGITINDLGGDLMYTWSDLNAALGGTPDGNIEFPPNSSSSSSPSSSTLTLASKNATGTTSPATVTSDTKVASNTTNTSVPSANSSLKQYLSYSTFAILAILPVAISILILSF